MLYLLDVMGELVNGERLIYVISEFWKALDNEIFSDFAKQKQKTIRKQNGLGIFDTQSPSDVLRHPIGRTMVEQSVTKIFLANPEAVREEYVEGFGLTEAEYDIVKSLGARGGRTFMVKQGNSSAICELDLTGLEDFVTVLSAHHRQRRAARRHPRTRGRRPQRAWLPLLLERCASANPTPKERPMKVLSTCSSAASHRVCLALSRSSSRATRPSRSTGPATRSRPLPYPPRSARSVRPRQSATPAHGTWSKQQRACRMHRAYARPTTPAAHRPTGAEAPRLWVVKTSAWRWCQYPDLGSKCVDMFARPPANLPYDAVQ